VRHHTHIKRGLTAVLASLLAATACATDSAENRDVSDGESFTRTIVQFGKGRAPVVKTREITAAQQRKEVALRRRGLRDPELGLGTASDAIVRDLDCAGESLWLFDRVNFRGNEICFHGEGTINLNDFFRRYWCDAAGCHTRTWARGVASYMAGEAPGHFGGLILTCEGFDAWQEKNDTSSCEAASTIVTLSGGSQSAASTTFE
jgi:hypothetical protein